MRGALCDHGAMGRGTPIRWERRTAMLADGRTIAWTWQPAGRYPQVITAHVDGAHIADRIEADGIMTRHADVAAELLRSIGQPDGAAHHPRT
jgi:hypothetical protein